MQTKALEKLKWGLFGNRTTNQTIFKNSFWLILADGLNRILTLVLFIYVARILGAHDYGKFAFAISLIYLFNILIGLNSPQIITRELAQDKERESEFPAIVAFNIILSLAVLALLFFVSFFATPDPVIRKVIWILAAYNFITSFLTVIFAFLRARQRMEYEALINLSQAVLITIFGLFVIFKLPSVESLGWAYLLAGLAIVIPSLILFSWKIYPLSLSWNKAVWKKMFSLSWPIALIGITVTLYTQIDTIMMGYLGQITQSGWYNAALKVGNVALAPGALISMSFFPVLSRLFKESKDSFQNIWNKQMGIMSMIALPLVVGGITLAPRIIDFFYGQSYGPSILAFQILIVMTGIIIFYDSFRQVMLVSNKQKTFFWIVLSGAAVNIILNLILIPSLSLYGAALATVVTHSLIFFLLVKTVLKYKIINPFSLKLAFSFLAVIVASLAMYLIISRPFVYYLPVILSIIIGLGTYLISFFFLRLAFNKLYC